MHTFISKILIGGFVIAGVGCTGSYKSQVNFNTSEPLRVAVLPFVEVDSSGAPVVLDADPKSARGKSQRESTATIQRMVQDELAKTTLDVVSPALITSALVHSGYDRDSDLEVDAVKVAASQPQKLCSTIFSCDAVLVGQVTDWSQTYYAIQSVSTVGISMKLISAKDGSTLFESKAFDADSRGLTKGPTGFSDLVIEPLRGLDGEILDDLARKVVRKAIAPLRADSRPEFLQSSPPGIYSTSHTAESGVLHKGRPLTVLLLGTPHHSASFSIGSYTENIPMVERGEGHYVGEYYALPEDKFSDQPVIVSLTDDFGRSTTQIVALSTVTLNEK